ncbi:MAG: helicase-exonuclease AddAB subunit AddA, partial [Bacillota bacterium]|nr:helicase-exonuclease AddAB subunit AddA [Bacillota bacterium]
MNWTNEQKKAIENPVANILVTAAAGSGKTQVLSGRILDRIKNHHADIDRLLVITFTNAAASEMRDRILKNLTEASRKNPKDKHLRNQLSLIGNADITTVHSFCLKVVRSYFYETGVDPSFRIADGKEADILKAEALEDTIEQFYNEGSPDFFELVDRVCSPKDDSNLSYMAEKIWSFSQSNPQPEKWLQNAVKAYENTEDIKDAPFIKIILENINLKLKNAEKSLITALDLAETDPLFQTYVNCFNNDLLIVRSALSKTNDWDELLNALKLNFGHKPTLKAKKDGPEIDEQLKEECSRLREQAKDLYKESKAFVSLTSEQIKEGMTSMLPPIKVLASMVLRFDENYKNKKAEKNLVDFSDLEHLAIKILSKEDDIGNIVPSNAALQLRDYYEEIYVDEYQDTNEIQETIFSLISGESKDEPNVFMVGDMKQSIYGFRMTNPKKLFKLKNDTYNESGKYVKIPLSKNFRSRSEVLDAVNFVFDMLMTERCGEVNYVGDERLCCGSEVYTEPLSMPAAQVELVISKPKTSAQDMRIDQARFAACKIDSLVKSGMTVYDKALNNGEGGVRPIKYSDIAILLRSTKRNAALFDKALSERNIPCFSDADSDFFESTEIRIFLSLLRIIDNPLQDISLVCVLRSPLFHFDEEHIAKIALKRRDYLYDSLCEYAAGGDKKAYRFMKTLETFRNDAKLLSVSELIDKLTEDTHYATIAGSMESGDIRLLNLRLLSKMAYQFDNTSFKGLFNFLKYIDKTSKNSDTGSAKMVTEDMNVVRIMSIHKSKGLEFPYVLLCCGESKFNFKDSQGSMLLHKELGIGIDFLGKDRTK